MPVETYTTHTRTGWREGDLKPLSLSLSLSLSLGGGGGLVVVAARLFWSALLRK